MTEEDRAKWLNEPPTRGEVANLFAQLGMISSSLANACSDLLAQDRQEATSALREVIADSREFSKILKEFAGSQDRE